MGAEISELKEIGIHANSRFLMVFSHPDDESVFASGLILHALHCGAHVKLVVLTCLRVVKKD